MITSSLALFTTLVLSVQAAVIASIKWTDNEVSEPKDFVVNFFDFCNAQIVFKRGGANKNDQSYSYSVLAYSNPPNKAEYKSIDFYAAQILPSTPISAVNYSAGLLSEAYRLQGEDSDYSLLPIQVHACSGNGDAGPPAEFQIKAVKKGKVDWYSPIIKVTSFTPPNQVTDLKAERDATDSSKVHVSWKASYNKHSTMQGAFILAGTRGQKIQTQFVDEDKKSTILTVGPDPVNVTVVRYNNGGNKALSDVINCPQVLV